MLKIPGQRVYLEAFFPEENRTGTQALDLEAQFRYELPVSGFSTIHQ